VSRKNEREERARPECAIQVVSSRHSSP
jgi:hypothetical protein